MEPWSESLCHADPQAELLEFRVAWLDAEKARLELQDLKDKMQQGEAQLLERQQELQESQAPVKCALDPP